MVEPGGTEPFHGLDRPGAGRGPAYVLSKSVLKMRQVGQAKKYM